MANDMTPETPQVQIARAIAPAILAWWGGRQVQLAELRDAVAAAEPLDVPRFLELSNELSRLARVHPQKWAEEFDKACAADLEGTAQIVEEYLPLLTEHERTAMRERMDQIAAAEKPEGS